MGGRVTQQVFPSTESEPATDERAANSAANTEHEGARWVRAALRVNPFDYEGQSPDTDHV